MFYLLFFCAQLLGFFAKKAVLKEVYLEKEPQHIASEKLEEEGKEAILHHKKHKNRNKK